MFADHLDNEPAGGRVRTVEQFNLTTIESKLIILRVRSSKDGEKGLAQ